MHLLLFSLLYALLRGRRLLAITLRALSKPLAIDHHQHGKTHTTTHASPHLHAALQLAFTPLAFHARLPRLDSTICLLTPAGLREGEASVRRGMGYCKQALQKET